MADGLIGKWQSVGFENIDPFWDTMGVPETMRQFARDKKTELTIEKTDGGWKLTTVAGDKSRVVTFPTGQEVDTITLMGEPVKAVLNESSGALVEVQKAAVGDITIHRSLVDGNLKTNMTLKGVTAGILFNKA
ncbi:fatty acid-binding protein, adipocyte-like [Babylonia areolata]|uniref:fatty acid-binding protein, adipocyte-like n=1 Tax=Babylonia areolata TaxID=304850 RepID=UPI003FD65595